MSHRKKLDLPIASPPMDKADSILKIHLRMAISFNGYQRKEGQPVNSTS